ncbi:MAG: ketoacyl-ACP synthase III [Proteobacteria bacterium]|nr:ketoacyl-ACP synthase III [Pseudomonadota bacterium]
MPGSAREPCTHILGTGHYLPAKVLTNRDLERLVDTSDAWIVERTGIRQRRVAADAEASSDMATAAALRALAAAEMSAERLDMIIVATITPDMPLPATAVFVQQNIGARSSCPAFDIAAACAGFIYALSVADSFVRAGQARYVLVVGVELLSRVLNWDDRTTCVLFGDGAGAVVVGPAAGEGSGILSTHLYSDGSLAHSLCIPGGGSRTPVSVEMIDKGLHHVHMTGRDIFKYAVRSLVDSARTAMEANGMQPSQVHWVVPHQANIRILDAVANRCGIPKERFCINIDRVGNTSSASIPIALDEGVRAGTIERGQHLLFCGLGGGLAWGSAMMRW